MGETRVDLLHLLEDIRDAYPGALEETILTEVLANALDSGAARIALTPDPAAATLIWEPGDGSDVIDGGAGQDTLDFGGANASEHSPSRPTARASSSPATWRAFS